LLEILIQQEDLTGEEIRTQIQRIHALLGENYELLYNVGNSSNVFSSIFHHLGEMGNIGKFLFHWFNGRYKLENMNLPILKQALQTIYSLGDGWRDHIFGYVSPHVQVTRRRDQVYGKVHGNTPSDHKGVGVTIAFKGGNIK